MNVTTKAIKNGGHCESYFLDIIDGCFGKYSWTCTNGKHKDHFPLFPRWSLWRGLTASARVFVSNPIFDLWKSLFWHWNIGANVLNNASRLSSWSIKYFHFNGVRIMKQIKKNCCTHTHPGSEQKTYYAAFYIIPLAGSGNAGCKWHGRKNESMWLTKIHH